MDITRQELQEVIMKLSRPDRCTYCVYNPEYTGKPNCSIYDLCEIGVDSFLNLSGKSFKNCKNKATFMLKEGKN